MQRIEEGNETKAVVVYMIILIHCAYIMIIMIYIMIIYQGKVPTSYQTGNG